MNIQISVLMPVFNAQRYLQAAIESVLRQSCRNFELICVDDGSSDRSPVILDRFAASDSRVRIIRRPNTGIVGALNDAFGAARGEYLARMDADDICLPERFAHQLRFLNDHPDHVLVGSRVIMIDTGSWPIGDMAGVAHGSDCIDKALLGGGWPIVHPTVMIRRDAFAAAGGYRDGTFPHEDHDRFCGWPSLAAWKTFISRC